MQKEHNISFKFFPFVMAFLLLLTLGAESTYAIYNGVNTTVDVSEAHQKDTEQGKTSIKILKDQQDAIPHSTYKIEWNNAFVKTIHSTNDFNLEVATSNDTPLVANDSRTSLSVETTCVMIHYAAPNAP